MKSPHNIILKIDQLSMNFGGLVAISDLSFHVERSQITSIIGPNGAGKTTAFNCITGFYKPTSGTITLIQKDSTEHSLEKLPRHEISRKAKVTRTFQNIRLFPGMTVLENLLVAQHNRLVRPFPFSLQNLFPGYLKKMNEQSIEIARSWLEKINLVERADHPAGDLPYGDQRRLEIVRAMCTEPELLCLDEPAAGLNPRESLDLNTLLEEIKALGTSILLIEHDMSVVMEISDRVVVLEYGKKISEGDPFFVQNDPYVIAAYLGEEVEESSKKDPLDDSLKRDLISAKKTKEQAGRVFSNSLSKPEKGIADNLLLIKGLEAAHHGKLNQWGIFHFKQISAWQKEDIMIAARRLKIKAGRLEKEWVKEAIKLNGQNLSENKNSKNAGSRGRSK